MLIVVLALWLIGISLVLRFFSVAGETRCGACDGELELWPEWRRCPDCGQVMADASTPKPVHARHGTDLEPIHALVTAVVQETLMQRGERAQQLPAPAYYQRASTGSTRSANSRTLS